MKLAALVDNRIAFDKAAIMRRAYADGRFAFASCRTQAERRWQLSHWLRKAWLAAKGEAAMLAQRAEREAETRVHLTARAAEAVSLAASFGNDAAAMRWEIQRENYRQHFNPARIDTLRAALSTLGA